MAHISVCSFCSESVLFYQMHFPPFHVNKKLTSWLLECLLSLLHFIVTSPLLSSVKKRETFQKPLSFLLHQREIYWEVKESLSLRRIVPSPNFLRSGRWWDLIDILKPYRDTIFSLSFPFHFSKSSWLDFFIIWCCCLSFLSISQVFAQLVIVFVELRCISEGFLRCRTKWSIPMKKQNFWYFSLIVQNSEIKKRGERGKKSF